MNYKVFRLLCDPRGAISKKEFQLGIFVLLILVQYYIFDLIINLGSIRSISLNQNIQYLANYALLKPLSIPILPVSFLVFYCSIVLAIKRVKDFGRNIVIGIFAGLSIFFFFDAVFFNIQNSLALSSNMEIEVNNDVWIFHLITLFGAIFIGLGILIVLLTFRGKKIYEKDRSEKGILTISQFIYQLGLLCIVTFILELLFFSIASFFPTYQTIALILIVVSSFVAILSSYLRIVYMRLKGAAKPFYYFLLCFTVFVLSLTFAVLATINSDNLNLVNISRTFLSIGTMIFAVANVLLFLLKETYSKFNLTEDGIG